MPRVSNFNNAENVHVVEDVNEGKGFGDVGDVIDVKNAMDVKDTRHRFFLSVYCI